MIVIPTSIVGALLLVVLWALEAYLFMICACQVLGRIRHVRTNQLYLSLEQLTYPVPRMVVWLAKKRRQPNPSWLPWAIVVLAVIVIRQILLWVVLSM